MSKFSIWFKWVVILSIPVSVFIGMLVILIATAIQKLGFMTPQISEIIDMTGPVILWVLVVIFGLQLIRQIQELFREEKAMSVTPTIDNLRNDLELVLTYGILTVESREAGERLRDLIDKPPESFYGQDCESYVREPGISIRIEPVNSTTKYDTQDGLRFYSSQHFGEGSDPSSYRLAQTQYKVCDCNQGRITCNGKCKLPEKMPVSVILPNRCQETNGTGLSTNYAVGYNQCIIDTIVLNGMENKP